MFEPGPTAGVILNIDCPNNLNLSADKPEKSEINYYIEAKFDLV